MLSPAPVSRYAEIAFITECLLPGTHLQLSQVKHMRVKCRVYGHTHRNNISTLREEKHDIFLSTGIEPARQAKPHA